MKYLTLEEVFLIHERIIDKFGGAKGVLNWGLLEAAVYRPHTSYEGKELYPDIFLKAAVLGHSLVLNHPFVDGNKRTAWEAMKRFLGENDIYAKAKTEEIVEIMMRIESKSFTPIKIAEWLKKHVR